MEFLTLQDVPRYHHAVMPLDREDTELVSPLHEARAGTTPMLPPLSEVSSMNFVTDPLPSPTLPPIAPVPTRITTGTCEHLASMTETLKAPELAPHGDWLKSRKLPPLEPQHTPPMYTPMPPVTLPRQGTGQYIHDKYPFQRQGSASYTHDRYPLQRHDSASYTHDKYPLQRQDSASFSPGEYGYRPPMPAVGYPGVPQAYPPYGMEYSYHMNNGENGHYLRKRRGNLPKEAVAKLKKWFEENEDSPYPSEEQKNIFVKETGLCMNQISNWFINARRRDPERKAKDAARRANQEGREPSPVRTPPYRRYHRRSSREDLALSGIGSDQQNTGGY